MRSIVLSGACLLLLSPFAGGRLDAQLTPPAMVYRPAAVYPSPTYLGVQLVDIDADRAARLKLSEERGVEVTGVEEGGPADAAGIRIGDALLSYNGENILGAQQLIRLVRETPAGRKVRLQISRDGKTRTVTVTVGTAPLAKPTVIAPSTFANFDIPEMQAYAMPDIPTAVLVWKSTMLGIECEGVSSQLAQFFGVKHGVLVRSVEKGTSGDRAGLKAGDILVSIGDRAINSPRDLNSFHRNLRADTKPIPLSVVRDRKTLTLNLTPGAANPE